jgi:hypothetical protein
MALLKKTTENENNQPMEDDDMDVSEDEEGMNHEDMFCSFDSH